jgi:hypothetical protein
MRRLFTADESGLTTSALRWGETQGRWRRLACQVYVEGGAPPSRLDRERAQVLARGGVARGRLAGVLHGLDRVVLGRSNQRMLRLDDTDVVEAGGIRCADGLVTLVDLAATLDDLTWEQALESALRRRLTTINAIETALPLLSAARIPGVARIRRVLALRPPGAPATGSLLETLMVQLARDVPEVGELVRQYPVWNDHEVLIALLDLSRPDLGFFIELDGEQHKDQPVYDSTRETAVVITTGMLPGRFTWSEVTQLPNTTKRKLAGLVAQAKAGRGQGA